MTTPQISRKYQFQIDLKGLRLPVSFTIPDMPDSPPLNPSHSWIAPDKDPHDVKTATHTSGASHGTDPREADSSCEGVDLPSCLSVSMPYSVGLQLFDVV
jgi:hypothetical protein